MTAKTIEERAADLLQVCASNSINTMSALAALDERWSVQRLAYRALSAALVEERHYQTSVEYYAEAECLLRTGAFQ